MARLETQINQIYYLPADAKQTSLILTDEALANNSHLFILADLVKIQKKTEIGELKKISEIILDIFRQNKKLSAETLFETSLALINQKLADLAHDGKKSWLGKLSSLIVLKNGTDIYLANSGQMTAMLYRNGEFLEVLDPEQRGLHPLKTFSNFTTGKIKAADVLLLTTSNLFNYVAIQNLNKLMADNDPAEVTTQVSDILKETGGTEEGFLSFFLTFTKTAAASAKIAAAVADPEPIVIPEQEEEPVASTEIESIQPSPVLEGPIYAPMPEDDVAVSSADLITNNKSSKNPRLLAMPKISLPKFWLKFPKFKFWQHLSGWAKFFLISFVIFLILFTSSIIQYTLNKHKKQAIDQTQSVIDKLKQDMSSTESALIYRNQSETIKLLAQATTDLEALKTVNPTAYNQYKPQVAELANRVNHITVVSAPKILATFKHSATDLARAGAGFYIADSATGTITTYNTSSSDKSGKDLFLLNKIGQIRGLAFIPNAGGIVVTSSEMYAVDITQSQFTLLHIYPKSDFGHVHFVNPDRLYTIDKTAGQALRVQYSKDTQINPVSLLKASVDMSTVVDIGTDTDVYLLSSSDLAKYSNGNLNTGFKIAQPTDKITSANRLFVANNIYITESAKKRLLIYNKQGVLLTQIFFPNSIDIRDLYVDEASRNIYLLDSNKLLSITF